MPESEQLSTPATEPAPAAALQPAHTFENQRSRTEYAARVLTHLPRSVWAIIDASAVCFGNYIGYKRLAARPEATLCIECKEEQERLEKNFKKRRQTDTKFPFMK